MATGMAIGSFLVGIVAIATTLVWAKWGPATRVILVEDPAVVVVEKPATDVVVAADPVVALALAPLESVTVDPPPTGTSTGSRLAPWAS